MTARENAKRIKREFKDTPKEAGIFLITNKINGKVLLGSSLNLHGPLNKHRFTLSIGSHINKTLQADWNRLGADAFSFEIVDVVKQNNETNVNLDDELTLLEEIWIEKENPFSERGYNDRKKIRE